MIDYTTWCEIRRLHGEGVTVSHIAQKLALHPKTVRTWQDKPTYRPRKSAGLPSKLDPYKEQILRLLETHAYSARQILREIQQAGYTGGRTILQTYVAKVRPPRRKAFLRLDFAPGECAQVDWGHAGSVQVGNTRRQLSFFVMVLGYSRMMYVAFTLSQKMEHFLDCHKQAFDFFGGVPRKVMIDNLKSAVLSHPHGGPVSYHPRYVDLAAHYGFEPRACTVRAPHEKGQVERAVSYVRANLLNGFAPQRFAPLEPRTRLWLDEQANVRVHGELKERPLDRFTQTEAPALGALPSVPYDAGVSTSVRASSQFRVTLDTNRYSVPAEYAGRACTLRQYPDRVVIYHDHQLIAEHTRSYQRREDVLLEEHQRVLLQQRKSAREQQSLSRLLRLSSHAERFVEGLEQRRLQTRTHILRTAALIDLHGADAVRRALEDAVELEAFSAEYILNLLEQRARPLPEVGPLHLTRNEDLLDLELPEPDLSIYTTPEPNHERT